MIKQLLALVAITSIITLNAADIPTRHIRSKLEQDIHQKISDAEQKASHYSLAAPIISAISLICGSKISRTSLVKAKNALNKMKISHDELILLKKNCHPESLPVMSKEIEVLEYSNEIRKNIAISRLGRGVIGLGVLIGCASLGTAVYHVYKSENLYNNLCELHKARSSHL